MSEEEIIINLNIEIQIAKNTLEHNKLYSKDEELISYNEENLDLLLGVRDLIEKQQKEIELVAKTYERALDMLVDKDNKIKEKIEKIKEDEEFYREQDRMYEFDGKINLLQELLGEEKDEQTDTL